MSRYWIVNNQRAGLFQSFDTRDQARIVIARQQHLSANEFENQTRSGRTAHLGQAIGHDVRVTNQRAGADMRRLITHSSELIFREFAQNVIGAVFHSVDDDEIAQPLEEILCESTWVVTRFNNAIDGLKKSRGIARGKRVHCLVQERTVCVSQELNRDFVSNAIFARASE